MSEGAKTQNQLPLLPLRDLIIFPHMMMPLFVGREKSIRALEEVMGHRARHSLEAALGIVDPPQGHRGDDHVEDAAHHMAIPRLALA